MFTGIVQGMARVIRADEVCGRRRLSLDLGELAVGLATGASVAVAGTCLTVVDLDNARVSFDVIAETLTTTTLGSLTVGDGINVERSLRFGDEVGGHVLSGHIAGMAKVIAVTDAVGERRVRLQVTPGIARFIFHKGFIALDGASLTVASVDRDAGAFEVALIPETLRRTTFGTIAVGAAVNVEIDSTTRAVVDTVVSLLASGQVIG